VFYVLKRKQNGGMPSLALWFGSAFEVEAQPGGGWCDRAHSMYYMVVLCFAGLWCSLVVKHLSRRLVDMCAKFGLVVWSIGAVMDHIVIRVTGIITQKINIFSKLLLSSNPTAESDSASLITLEFTIRSSKIRSRMVSLYLTLLPVYGSWAI